MQRQVRRLLATLATRRLARVAELERSGKLALQKLLTGLEIDSPPVQYDPEAAGGDTSDIATEGSLPEEGLPVPGGSGATPSVTGAAPVDDEATAEGEAVPSEERLARHIGVDSEAFPEVTRLSVAGVEALNRELAATLAAFGHPLGAPADYPARLTYRALVRKLREPLQPTAPGTVDADGCTGRPVGCRWGPYCTCLRYWTAADFEAAGGDPSQIDPGRFRDPDAAEGFDWRRA